MVGAEELLRTPAARAQHVAAVATGVDEAAQLAVLAPDDDVGLVEDLVLLPVPGLGKLIGAAHYLPGPHPDLLSLTLLDPVRRVAVRRDAHLQLRVVEVRGAQARRFDPPPGPYRCHETNSPSLVITFVDSVRRSLDRSCD